MLNSGLSLVLFIWIWHLNQTKDQQPIASIYSCSSSPGYRAAVSLTKNRRLGISGQSIGLWLSLISGAAVATFSHVPYWKPGPTENRTHTIVSLINFPIHGFLSDQCCPFVTSVPHPHSSGVAMTSA